MLFTTSYAFFSSTALPGCASSCGGVDIPYPFGLGSNCAFPGFEVTSAEVRISNSVTWQCRNFSTNKTISGPDGVVNLNNTHFSFSSSLNKLIVIGCNTLGESNVSLGGRHPYGRTGCVSFCINAHFDQDYGPCAGVGCCQIDIHRGLKFSQVCIETKMYSYFPGFNPCRYAVLMEAAAFNFSTAYVNGTTSLIGRNMSLVLDWTIGNSSCINSSGSKDYLCKSMDSTCSNSRIGGYTCHCSDGFEGNPYVKGGCTDINECARNYTCQPNQKCVNTVGTYKCVCPWGMRVNGEGRCDLIGRMTIFGIEELEKTTNKFNETLIVGRGGHGIIYKGILADQRIVAVKKPKIEIDREIEEFLNEVVILSQLNHRNVVKLFGCCIENDVPLVVYEFGSNGTLTDHLHVEEGPSLSWNDRLQIALETAGALSYLHTAASMSVFHRDIKTSNILLNDGLATKLSDFGASRSVAADVVTAKDTEI
ncbi:hypothetical protein LUZ60_016507 [Juncus effusus]|nr:hypothetical protein LUZ60_016507 [Juncus effusus]